jgi:soluble lytic murein transglycosylase-like protein
MKKLLILTAILAVVICIVSFNTTKETSVKLNPAQRLYASIMTYAEQYDIPLHVAFNVARIETGYRGPFHNNYNHKQTSSAGALGPMQIMPQYASHYAGFKVKKPVLKDSIELNVHISMKMLRDWYNRYNDWGKAAGAYNTGKPVMNSYARNAIKKNYIDHWIKPDSTDVMPDTLAYLSRVDLVAFLKD